MREENNIQTLGEINQTNPTSENTSPVFFCLRHFLGKPMKIRGTQEPLGVAVSCAKLASNRLFLPLLLQGKAGFSKLTNFTALKCNPLPALPAAGITGLQIRGLAIQNQFPGYLRHGLEILLWSALHGLLVLIFSDAESKASSLQVPAILFNAFFEAHFPRCCRRDTSSEAQLGPSIV